MSVSIAQYLLVLAALSAFGAFVVGRLVTKACAAGSTNMTPARAAEFASFQQRYLVVYLLCTFSDWLKGPYVYALYEEYGFSTYQISLLFGGGFVSSLLFGTLVGAWSDKFGRKRMCLVFCAVYALSALTKPFNSFALLFIGRLLSGVATSLLFTAFESWMVAEHRARDFPEELLTNTFSKATLGNGVVAVLAGFVAQGAAGCCGYAAPFLVAVPCLGAAAVAMRPWRENYGDAGGRVMQSLADGLATVRNDTSLLALGLCESLFEATIYVWVFYWTPAVAEGAAARRDVPFGLLFAAYMGAFMVGGCLPDLTPTVLPVAYGVHIAAAAGLGLSAFAFDDKLWVFIGFVVFEGSVGAYFPTHGTLRSVHVPEATRASVMNLFRFPMNLIVVGVLQLGIAPRSVIGGLAVQQLVALAALRYFHRRSKAKRNDDDDAGGAPADGKAVGGAGGQSVLDVISSPEGPKSATPA